MIYAKVARLKGDEDLSSYRQLLALRGVPLGQARSKCVYMMYPPGALDMNLLKEILNGEKHWRAAKRDPKVRAPG